MGKSLVQDFITDEFKSAVQVVLDKALHGEETTYVKLGFILWNYDFWDMVPAHNIILFLSGLSKKRTRNNSRNFEFPLITTAGVRLDVLLNATTRRDEQGNIIGVVGFGQDVTGKQFFASKWIARLY